MIHKIPKQINLLLLLNGLSILGNAITEVAIPWLILEISGSPLLVASVMAAKIVPVILSVVFSAQVVDKFGAFRVSVASDLVNFFCILLIPLFYHVGLMDFVVLAILLMASTLLDSPGRLARDVMLAREIKHDNHQNERINGLNGTIENVCDLAGPALAGVIIAALGTFNALYFDAMSFLAVSLGLMALRKHFSADISSPAATTDHSANDSRHANQSQNTVNDASPTVIDASPSSASQSSTSQSSTSVKPPSSSTKPMAYLADAFRFLWQAPSLFSVLIVSALVNVVITPLLFVYLPFYNKTVFDSVIGLGLSMMFFGAGTTLSSFLYSAIGQQWQSRHIILWGYSSLVLLLASLSVTTGQWMLYGQLLLIGCCIGCAGPVETTMIQRQVPDGLFSRIMTLFSASRFLSVPVGYLVFGGLLEAGFFASTPLLMAATVFSGVLAYAIMSRRSVSPHPSLGSV